MGKEKFVNPVDKARKDARKKELKKNKKQRFEVRSKIVEKLDPDKIIADLEELDKCSGDDVKYKRKKLIDSWEQILNFHKKKDEEMYSKLKNLFTKYEVKRKELKAIKEASEVEIASVFLPPPPKEETVKHHTQKNYVTTRSEPGSTNHLEAGSDIKQQDHQPVIDTAPVIEAKPVLNVSKMLFVPNVVKYKSKKPLG